MEMPRIGLGTYKLQGQTCYQATLSALRNGYKLIDTAAMYKNQLQIARAIKDSGITRENLYLTSKLWVSEYENPQSALTRQLNLLQTTYLDMYMIHYPFTLRGAQNYPEGNFDFSYIPCHTIYRQIEKLVDKGLVRQIGICNFPACLVLDCLAYSRIKPQAIQIEVHPYNVQEELVDFCQRNGIKVVAYGALGGVNYSQDENNGLLLEHPVVRELAEKYGKTTGQVLLNFALARGLFVIPKATSSERQRENLEEFEMEREDVERMMNLNRDYRFYGKTFFEKLRFPLFK